MMEGGMAGLIWRERWRLGAWVVPAVMAVFFAHHVLLPLAGRLGEARAGLSALKENTYESSWLDSTQAALREEAMLLKAFHASRRAALASDSSVQAAVDRIRALAQGSGIEVIKTTPIISRVDSLALLKVRVEGYARYSGLLDLFSVLRKDHPDLYLDEMLIRQGGERAGGRLETLLELHAYSEVPGAMR